MQRVFLRKIGKYNEKKKYKFFELNPNIFLEQFSFETFLLQKFVK